MRILSVVFLLMLASPSFAEETTKPAAKEGQNPENDPPSNLIANAGVSALINTGNSRNRTFGGNGLFSYKWDKNKVESTMNGNYSRGTTVDPVTGIATTSTTTKNWLFQQRYDRFLLDPVSVFLLGHVGQDPPAGFDLRSGAATGISHEFWKVDPDYAKYEVGFDYTRENRTVPPDANIYSIRLFVRYTRKISSWASVGQDVESLFNVVEGDDIRLNTLTTVTAKLTNKLALQAGYGIRFDNVPVTGKKKTDTTTQLGLVLNFM